MSACARSVFLAADDPVGKRACLFTLATSSAMRMSANAIFYRLEQGDVYSVNAAAKP
ncbi:hypothetical protein SAMN06265221_1141 [Paracoccus laeviglucosivorans]|uniref:Uncharacterized protein n=1 Tax=Paracoccus laeviglucosivorans TaxID=1197861 RepID=A0A521ENI3_9RHOB|nr:hypothetical protein SAMN06265221_1141 [Paracoccus laeviglucosivorans]